MITDKANLIQRELPERVIGVLFTSVFFIGVLFISVFFIGVPLDACNTPGHGFLQSVHGNAPAMVQAQISTEDFIRAHPRQSLANFDV